MKFMARPSKYPQELRQRAVRLVAESKGEYPSEFEAIRSIAAKLGIGSPETLRKWVRRAEIDGGQRPGKTSDDIAEIRELKKEVAELRRANEILQSGGCRTNDLRRPGRRVRCVCIGHSAAVRLRPVGES
jgi:transposase